MADFLNEQAALLTSKNIILEPPQELEEELCRPIKKLKGQVESVSLID